MDFDKEVTKTTSIKNNINFSSVSVSILPQCARWYDMEGFKEKKYGPFKYTFVDENHCIVVEMEFFFSFSSRGTYNGQGSFLADVTVLPEAIFVAPGYFLDADVTAGSAINYGTKENPIAGVTLSLKAKIKGNNGFKLMGSENNSSKSISDMRELDCTDECSINEIEIYVTVSMRGDGTISLVAAYGY